MSRPDLQPLVDSLQHDTGGSIAFAFRDLQNDELVSYRGDEPVATASVIKLPVLLHLAIAVEEGQLAWDDQLTLTDQVKVPGSGVLKELSAGLRLSLRDLGVLMIVLSDNTATNMLLDLVGIAAINQRMAGLGYPQTRLLRRAYTADTPASRRYGLGVTTPHEIAGLLARLARRQIGSPAVADTILAILARQQDLAAIPRYLPGGWSYAGKTGSNTDLRNDVGLLTASDGRQMVLAAFCSGMPRVDWTLDNPGLLAIGRLARALVTADS